jgi:hypothetical protein
MDFWSWWQREIMFLGVRPCWDNMEESILIVS